MKIEIDTNTYDKYEVEGEIAFSGRLKTDKIYTHVNDEGLINQSKTLDLENLYNLVNAKQGDKVKITIEKL